MIKKLKQLIYPFIYRERLITTNNLQDLIGKTVVITGGSEGVGKAITELLYKKGAKVAVISRSAEAKNPFFGFDRQRFMTLNADVTNESDVKIAINNVVKKFGRVDVLINNAGRFSFKPLEDTTLSDLEKVLNVNVKGVFLMCREVIPLLKKQNKGLIINMGSKISRNSNVSENKVIYAASKYALEGFSFALNKELNRFGIRVTCLMPGTINSFLSLKSDKYVSVYDLAKLVHLIITLEKIDFEGLIFKSVENQI